MITNLADNDAAFKSRAEVDPGDATGHAPRREEKRARVIAALEQPVMASLSDRALARQLGVSQPFVGDVRRRLATDRAALVAPLADNEAPAPAVNGEEHAMDSAEPPLMVTDADAPTFSMRREAILRHLRVLEGEAEALAARVVAGEAAETDLEDILDRRRREQDSLVSLALLERAARQAEAATRVEAYGEAVDASEAAFDSTIDDAAHIDHLVDALVAAVGEHRQKLDAAVTLLRTALLRLGGRPLAEQVIGGPYAAGAEDTLMGLLRDRNLLTHRSLDTRAMQRPGGGSMERWTEDVTSQLVTQARRHAPLVEPEAFDGD